MKMKKTMFRLVVNSVIIFAASNLFSQDLPFFHVVDNFSVGLSPTAFEKFGVAVADIDRNGYPDILCTRWQGDGFSQIYLNSGGTFQNISGQTPMEQIEGTEEGKRTYTPLWVDFDNDGDKDLCFSTISTFHLLLNDGNNFTDVAQERGLESYKPPGFIMEWDVHPGAWADYDLDGDLDFVASQLNNPNLYLFRNDDGLFTNVASEAGLDSTDMTQSWSLTFEDVDLDGDADLFSKNTFYLNENGIYTDATETIGITGEISTNYREMFDYDNDGDLDYIRVNSQATDESTIQLWENQGGVFVNVSEDAALSQITNPTRSITVGDFDNDGDQDVFVHNNFSEGLDLLLLNEEVEPGERVFVDVANMVGITVEGDRKGTAFIDYNMDGFLDNYTSTATMNHILYHNEGNGNNWLGLMMEGTVSNRDAVGSLITLHIGDQIQIRTKKCGNHVASQGNPFIHFGIGQSTEIDSIVIKWPSGIRQVLTGLPINQYHIVQESNVAAVDEKENSAKLMSYELAQNYPNPFNPTTTIQFKVPKSSHVRLVIYDVLGREVKTLINRKTKPGVLEIVWDGTNRYQNPVPGGVYFCRMESEDFEKVIKLALVR